MAGLRYTKSHEWARVEGDVATIGISQHAVDELNDLTYLDFRVEEGDAIERGAVFGEVDSVKATSELYAPVSGTVEAINARFRNEAELPTINASPYDEGWLIKIKLSDPSQLDEMLDEDAYKRLCAEG